MRSACHRCVFHRRQRLPLAALLLACVALACATKHTSANDALAAQMGEAARELLAQGELPRADVRRFRI